MRFKDQNAQEQKIYTKHSMDLRNKRFENLLVLEESWDSVVVLMFAGETDAPRSSK